MVGLASHLFQEGGLGVPFQYTILSYIMLHYTNAPHATILFYGLVHKSLRWHPNLFQGSGQGILFSLYYTMSSLAKVDIASPAHPRTWLRRPYLTLNILHLLVLYKVVGGIDISFKVACQATPSHDTILYIWFTKAEVWFPSFSRKWCRHSPIMLNILFYTRCCRTSRDVASPSL